MADTITDVRAASAEAEEELERIVIPERPAPTPEQAALGIMPAAIGGGTIEDIMEIVRSLPRLDDDEYEAFERAIAENRRMRRQLALERGE